MVIIVDKVQKRKDIALSCKELDFQTQCFEGYYSWFEKIIDDAIFELIEVKDNV